MFLLFQKSFSKGMEPNILHKQYKYIQGSIPLTPSVFISMNCMSFSLLTTPQDEVPSEDLEEV